VIAKEMEGFVVSGDEEEEGEENKSESELMRSSLVRISRVQNRLRPTMTKIWQKIENY
jgi:hypothetical protein